MKVEVLDCFLDNSLPSAWTKILTKMQEPNPQFTYEWVSTCWEVFGEKKELLLITITDNGKIIGIAPLMITDTVSKIGFKSRKLTFVGDGLTDYHDILIGDKQREEALETLFEFIFKENQSWDVVQLRNVPANSPNLPVLEHALRHRPSQFVERILVQCPYIPINSSWEVYCNTLPSKLIGEIRRAEKKLSQIGGIAFSREHKLTDTTTTLNGIATVHSKRQESKNRDSWYSNEKRRQFALLILERFSEKGWLDLSMLAVGERIAAYALGFLYNNAVFYWNTAFDPEFYQRSPGKVLLQYLIRDSFVKQYKEFDFMVGAEPYKLQWTDSLKCNYEVLIFKNTLHSNLLRYYYNYKPILREHNRLNKMGIAIASKLKH